MTKPIHTHQASNMNTLPAPPVKPTTRIFAVLASATLALHAQSWETLVALGEPNADAIGHAVMLDPFSPDSAHPDLFLGGESLGGSVLQVDLSAEPPAASASDAAPGSMQRLVADAFGNLYAAGYQSRAGRAYWQVRRSSNGDASWVVVDDAHAWNKDGGSAAQGLTTDLAGNVFASGSAQDRQGKEFWVIRRGLNRGQTWATVYRSSKPQAKGMGAAFLAPTAAHAGGVFAVGTLTATKTTQWSVLRSRDSGGTWQWVDAWGPSRDNEGAQYPRAVAADGAGNVYVAGYDVTGVPAWYVRRSQDGGDAWQTILSEYTDGDYNRADDIAADPWGNVYVAGLTKQPGSNARWTVRRWDAATRSWDQWPHELRHPLASWASVSVAHGIVSDGLGRVYVTGSADGLWIVQRLVLP